MSRKIHKSGAQGITIDGFTHLIAQFADDTQLFLKTEEDVKKVIRTLADIETNTGLKINYDKSNILTVGDAQPFVCEKPLVWDPGGVNLLGITLDADENEVYLNLLAKVEHILGLWYNRHLSLYGKIVLINSLISSLFVYNMQVLNGPNEHFYKEYNKIINQYLWNGGKPKISMKILQASKINGGLKLSYLRIKNQSLKIAWLFKDNVYTKGQT